MATAGAFPFSPVPYYPLGAGLRHQYGTLLPPGGEVVAYVSASEIDGIHSDIAKRRFTTLNAALAACRSGRGDAVVVLPGHTESISTADQMSNLVAGTRIFGTGMGTSRPTFTWTAATATFLFDVANVQIDNCILNLDPGTGTTTVAAPITISAAGCAITNCQIRGGTDANSLVTIGITTTAAADDLVMTGNYIYGAAAAECTTMIQFVGADRLRFCNNFVESAQSSASVGCIRFLTTASTSVLLLDNIVSNLKSGGGAGDQAITGMAGLSGYADRLHMCVLGNNVASLTAAFGTPASMRFGRQVYVNNTIAERASLFGTEAA